MAATLTNNNDDIYYIHPSMSCGDGFQKTLKHTFKGTKEQVDLLVTIIKEFDICELNIIDELSFSFKSKKQKIQRFVFKLCRYIRNIDLLEILKVTKKCIDLNIPVYNSFLIGHYCKEDFKYYNSNMDIIIISRYSKTRKLFKTKEDFLERLNKKGLINSIYKSSRYNINKILISLVKDEKYKEAEALLLKL